MKRSDGATQANHFEEDGGQGQCSPQPRPVTVRLSGRNLSPFDFIVRSLAQYTYVKRVGLYAIIIIPRSRLPSFLDFYASRHLNGEYRKISLSIAEGHKSSGLGTKKLSATSKINS